MPVYGLGPSSTGRAGRMGPGVLLGSTAAPAAPVAVAPVSPSAAYYYDPEEDARRVAAIQARIQSGIAAEQAASRARSQRRSRGANSMASGGADSMTNGGSNAMMSRPDRGMAVAPQGGMMMDPGVVLPPPPPAPEQYADSSGMTYPAGTPQEFADSSGMSDYYNNTPQAYASNSGMDYPGPQYADSTGMWDAYGTSPQAYASNSGIAEPENPVTYDSVDNAPTTEAPVIVVTPEQAAAAAEGLMDPVYLSAGAPATNPGLPAGSRPVPQLPGSGLLDRVYGALAGLFRTPVPSAYDAVKRAYNIQ